MRAVHTRTQYGIGQGGFHAAEVVVRKSFTEDGNNSFRFSYVYDCGTQSNGAYLSEAIERFTVKYGLTHDCLFISHLDEDHVSHIPTLLRTASFSEIIMPLFSAQERLYKLGFLADKGRIRNGTPSFFQQILVDPVGTLSQFAPESAIVLVRPAEDVDSAGGTEPDRSSATSPNHARVRSTTRYSKDVGNSGNILWKLTTYVDPSQQGKWAEFNQRLQQAFPPSHLWANGSTFNPESKDDVLSVLGSTTLIEGLRSVYRSLGRSTLNGASLFVLSTPSIARCIYRSFTQAHCEQRLHREDERERYCCQKCKACCNICGKDLAWLGLRYPYKFRGGWLGTGDAFPQISKTRNPARVRNLVAFFGSDLAKVGTVMMPHHGAANNSHADFYRAICPELVVIPAGRQNRYRHPTKAALVASRLTCKVQTFEGASFDFSEQVLLL